MKRMPLATWAGLVACGMMVQGSSCGTNVGPGPNIIDDDPAVCYARCRLPSGEIQEVGPITPAYRCEEDGEGLCDTIEVSASFVECRCEVP